MTIELRNPHSVIAAINTRPHDVVEIRLHSNQVSGAWNDAVNLAGKHGITVRRGVEREKHSRRQRRSSANTERTGAAVAIIKERSDFTLDMLFADAAERKNGHGLWLALDCLQDPHNVGAIFRTASFYGVEGIIVTKDRSAPLNATVYDIAAGGLEYTPISLQPNLSRALETAQKAGLWILGASEHAEKDISQVPHDRPWLLVLGNEEKGLRRLTLEKCDEVCRLSPQGQVTSLNVSVAAGILISTLSTGSAVE